MIGMLKLLICEIQDMLKEVEQKNCTFLLHFSQLCMIQIISENNCFLLYFFEFGEQHDKIQNKSAITKTHHDFEMIHICLYFNHQQRMRNYLINTTDVAKCSKVFFEQIQHLALQNDNEYSEKGTYCQRIVLRSRI